jgi:hypothetical protein
MSGEKRFGGAKSVRSSEFDADFLDLHRANEAGDFSAQRPSDRRPVLPASSDGCLAPFWIVITAEYNDPAHGAVDTSPSIPMPSNSLRITAH